MDIRLTESQRITRDAARAFAVKHILPVAETIDREKNLPKSLVNALAAEGWLGCALPVQWGGGGLDPVAYGLATEEFGRACSSVRSLLTSHNMAAQAILRHGSSEQKQLWLPDLCTGRKIISFALTEEDSSSMARTMRAEAVEKNGGYLLNGTKIWITCGLISDLYLVFARIRDKPLALVVDRDFEGVAVQPTPDVLGTRGSMLGRLQLNNVDVAVTRRIGPEGAGITFVANTSLDHGRFSVAWGAAGIIQASLDACHMYLSNRHQNGRPLTDNQLIKRHLTEMLLEYTTVRALCFRCGCLRQTRDQRASVETTLAKYHGAAAAVRVTTDALRLHGANGYSLNFPVERYLRDAMALEIIEGTRELNQVSIAAYALQWPHLND